MTSIKSKAQETAAKAGDASPESVQKVGEAVQRRPAYRVFVSVGLIAYGAVHVVIAIIASGIALGDSSSGEASSSGAFEAVASQPFGFAALAIAAAGLAALALWQLIEACVGNTQFSGSKRLRKRVSSLGRTALYSSLSFAALRPLIGARSGSSSEQESLVSTVLSWPAGQLVVCTIGLVVICAGAYHVVKGVKKKFKEDLDGSVPSWAVAAGQVGYTAKGASICIVGALVGWAGFRHEPSAAGNTDSALRSLLEQPGGPALLVAMAAGLGCFAIFCFVWAFNANHHVDNSSLRPGANR